MNSFYVDQYISNDTIYHLKKYIREKTYNHHINDSTGTDHFLHDYTDEQPSQLFCEMYPIDYITDI